MEKLNDPMISMQVPHCVLEFFQEWNIRHLVDQKEKKQIQTFLSWLAKDEHYFEVIEYIFLLAHERMELKKLYQGNPLDWIKDKDSVVKLKEIQEGLLGVENVIKDLIRGSLEQMDGLELSEKEVVTKPRFVRLVERMELSEKEVVAMQFVVLSQVGVHFPTVEGNVSQESTMGIYARMSSHELLNFLSSQRVHLKNGLITIDSKYQNVLAFSVIKMPMEICKVLVGSSLTAEEMLKIDQTILNDILLQEPSFDSTILKEPSVAKKEDKDLSHEADDEENEQNWKDLLAEVEQENDPLQYPKIDEVNNDANVLTKYTTNIEYLEDRFLVIATKVKLRNAESEQKEESDYHISERSHEAIIRELKAKERMLIKKCERRLELTTEFTPRLEKLRKIRKLGDFDCWILLCCISGVISHDVNVALQNSFLGRRSSSEWTVGRLLFILCGSLSQSIHFRRNFYKSSPLIKEGMIKVDDRLSGDLMECGVVCDRRILDYLVGLDTELNELIDGSVLFQPKVQLSQVILPEAQKAIIVDTVCNFSKFQTARKKMGFDEIIPYGNSLVLLFHGESGVGKTMLAKALANYVGKKMLLINFSSLGADSGEALKYIFREAKMNDALLFFDECESIFQSRDKPGSYVTSLLTEIERHDSMVIMATNRPDVIDEAMHRRITISTEFKAPDPTLRLEIWKRHFPKGLKLSDDVDFEKLSMKYELTGGLIKNSVISALSFAVSRQKIEEPTICMEDIEKGAQLQLRGSLQMNKFERRVISKHGIDRCVLSTKIRDQLSELVSFEKARKILFNKWGFGEFKEPQGTSILLHGESGTGKHFAVQGVAFELSMPIRMVDSSELLSRFLNSTSKNIQSLFDQAKKSNAIILIDAKHSGIRSFEQSLDQLLWSIQNYNGLVFLVTNQKEFISESMLRHFKFVIEFTPPNAKLRRKLWSQLIPKSVPLGDVNFDRLANNYAFTGGQIENVIYRAAARCSLRKDCTVLEKDLITSCEEEVQNSGIITGRTMYH